MVPGPQLRVDPYAHEIAQPLWLHVHSAHILMRDNWLFQSMLIPGSLVAQTQFSYPILDLESPELMVVILMDYWMHL